MARKLPWSSDGSLRPSKSRSNHVTSTAPKREIKEDVSKSATPISTPQKPRRRASSRSPSTSPIRPPAQTVPQVESMRPGLSHDDGYIMVEDEFESTAREFTAHLHAAEYARLRAKARALPPRTLPSPTTNLPGRTMRDLERKHLLGKQTTALKRMRSGDDGEDADAGDLWTGTSLANLMDGNGEGKTSLIGLQRVASGTRAAMGFSRASSARETGNRPEKRTIEDIFDDFAAGDHGAGRKRDGDERKKVKDAAGTARQGTVEQTTSPTRVHARAREVESGARAKSQQNSKPTPRRSRVFDLSYYEDDDSKTVPAHKPTPSKPSLSRVSKPVKKERDRKDRLDEVPIFLI